MHRKNQFNQPIGDDLSTWLPTKKVEYAEMRGQYCVLLPVDIEQHAAALFDVLKLDQQDASLTYLSYDIFTAQSDFEVWLTYTTAQKVAQLYVIADRHSAKLLGLAGYFRMLPQHGVIEIGHLHFSKMLQGTTAATEAIFLMLCRAFDESGYRRCEWKCDALNQPSREAAERLGFKFEGIFRQHLVTKQRNRDTAWFSMLDSEWPLIKQRMQKWLSADNFDSQGKQKKRLNEL